MQSATAFLVWRDRHPKRTLSTVPHALMDAAMSELFAGVPPFRS
jgi:hypothetical protein